MSTSPFARASHVDFARAERDHLKLETKLVRQGSGHIDVETRRRTARIRRNVERRASADTDAQRVVLTDRGRRNRGIERFRGIGGALAAASKRHYKADRTGEHAYKRHAMLHRFDPLSVFVFRLLPADLVFAPTLAHRGFAAIRSTLSFGAAPRRKTISEGCVLLLGYAMLARDKPDVYVDPFDRICHGLGGASPRNYRPERSSG